MGLHSAAHELGLDFVPLLWEPYDVALPASALGAARPLIAALRDPAVRATIEDLGGYDITEAGAVHPVSS